MAAYTTDFEKPDWQVSIEKRFKLYKHAIQHEDAAMLGAVRAQDLMADTEPKAEYFKLARELGPRTLQQAEDDFKQLENKALETNQQADEHCKDVKKKLEEMADSDQKDDPDAWEKSIRDNMGKLKEKTNKEIDDLQEWSINKIKQMPPKLRKPAANAVNGSANAIGGFVLNAVNWLRGAIDTIWNWLKQAWETIKVYAKRVGEWFSGAWSTIKGWFSFAALTYMASTKAVNVLGGPGSPHHHDLAQMLQKLGMENFTLIRKDGSWLVEPM